MRTTLDIDEDVLNAAKELSRQQKLPAGKIVSRLLRQALTQQGADPIKKRESTVGGFRPFSGRDIVVTDDDIDQLRDEEGI